MGYCTKCGAALPPSSEFCPRCGTPVATSAPPTTPTTPPAPPVAHEQVVSHRSMWWILPAAIVGLVVVLWLLLSGLPFGRDEKPPKPARVETIAEGTAPRETGTLVDVPVERDDDSEPVAPPPAPRATVNVDARTPASRPPAREAPPPAREVPPPAPRASSEITAAEADATLRNYVTSTNYYRLGSDCIRVQNRGYSNAGFALEVWSSCGEGGASRRLGRWRVDAKTREVFRQQDDGRYLRP